MELLSLHLTEQCLIQKKKSNSFSDIIKEPSLCFSGKDNKIAWAVLGHCSLPWRLGWGPAPLPGIFGGMESVGPRCLHPPPAQVRGAGCSCPRGWLKSLCVLQFFEVFLMLLRMNAISFSMLNKLKMVDFSFHKFVFLTFIGDCSLFTIFSEVWELLALSDKFSPLGSTSRKKGEKQR